MERKAKDKAKYDFYTKRQLHWRRMEAKDLEVVDQLCRDVHFEIGYHNLKLYFETSPMGWDVVYDQNNQLILISGTNELPNDHVYGYLSLVRKDWQGQRLTKIMDPGFLTSACIASMSNKATIRDMGGKHWLDKRLGLYGLITKRIMNDFTIPKIEGITIEGLRPEFLDQLLEYDRKISLIDRRGFVKEWSMPDNRDHGESVLAVDEKSGRCLGYGTMRLFSDYHGIQPLYAENDEIARALMIALTKWCFRKDANLYMPLMAKKRAALEFCYKIGLIITGTEMRNCSTKALQYAKALPIEKVYSVHEYYPV